MSKSNTLQALADAAGKPLEIFVPEIIREAGSVFQAAMIHGVAPNTINYWLQRNKYEIVRTIDVRRVAGKETA